jgi:hypothetical protein
MECGGLLALSLEGTPLFFLRRLAMQHSVPPHGVPSIRGQVKVSQKKKATWSANLPIGVFCSPGPGSTTPASN